MDADAQKVSLTLQSFFILSAIPLAIFALWADYYGRHIDKLKADHVNFDAEMESARIRLASVSVIIFQLILLLSSSALRRSHPFAVNGLLVAAVLIQGWMQAQAEKKLGLPQENSRDRVKRGLIGFVWISTSVLAYMFIVLLSTTLFGFIAHVLGASQSAGFILNSLGAIAGLVIGMGLNFALAPVHLRMLIPTTRLESELPVLAENCREAFQSCGLAAPDLFLMKSQGGRGVTAFISGFRWGRGPFKPALFISRELIEKLTPDEVRAVIFHELSHVLLNHLLKRFAFASGLVSGLTLIGIAITLFSSWAFPKDPTAQQLMPILAIISFFAAFRWIGHQSQKQEVEADYFTITRLAVELETFALALRKLDQINQIGPDQSGRMHPSTELRIAVLEHVLGNSRLRKDAKTKADSEKKAA